MKIQVYRNAIVFLALFFFQYILAYADVSFVATVDRNPVEEGGRFEVSFTLNNATGTNFTPPQFNGFSNVWGPSHSTNMQIINGVVSQSVSYVYTIVAGKEGNYSIGSASIKVNGKEYKTNPLTIKVVKGSQKGNQQSQQNQQYQSKSFTQQANDYLKDKLFIKIIVNKRSLYVGEQLVVSYKLYYKPDLDLVGITSAKIPTFNNFWSSEVNLGQQQRMSEIIDGVQYMVQDLKKFVLVPQKSGNLKLDPLEIDIVVRIAVRSGFWPTYENYTYKLKSGSLDINAMSLPSNAPANFNGIVGNYSIDTKLDRNNTVTNDPVKLRVEVSGTGNFKLLDAPQLDLPQDIEVYPPNITDNWNLTANGYSGSKVFEYLLVPKNPGEFRLNPVKFAHFNVSKGQYISYISPEITLTVGKGSGTFNYNTYTQNQEQVKLLSKDIEYIRDAPSSFEKHGRKFFNSLLFYILTLSPFLIFIVFIIIRNKQEKLYSDTRLLKNKKAMKIARKRLSKARELMQRNSEHKFFEEVSNALWHYVSDKTGIPFADLSKIKITECLMQKSISEERIESLMNILQICELAMFSPETKEFDMPRVYNTALEIITDLEGKLG